MHNIIRFQKKNQGDVRMCTILKRIRNKTALELLEEYGIELTPPIDIALLLDKIGISVIAKDFSEIENKSGLSKGTILGAAVSKGNNLAIFYNKFDTYNRKIFTIAHELGHCCKHSNNLEIAHVELRVNTEKLDSHEIEANIFAGELLMPEKILLEKYEEFIIPSLDALSKIFGVSSNVMAARLDYLGLDYFKDTGINEG